MGFFSFRRRKLIKFNYPWGIVWWNSDFKWWETSLNGVLIIIFGKKIDKKLNDKIRTLQGVIEKELSGCLSILERSFPDSAPYKLESAAIDFESFSLDFISTKAEFAGSWAFNFTMEGSFIDRSFVD